MTLPPRRGLCRVSTTAFLAISVALLASCTTPQPKSMVQPKKARSSEYFAESAYGVKASPRVTNQRTRLPRGGGRDQTGRPYKVAGKWYYPKEDKNYRKVGAASWYGEAFHGRLTANGEIYDMTHLTAAHPTMPLPSYARVTNTSNGSSVIVRVNDRGAYAQGRVIDLSKRAAELLGYTQDGTATVEVAYIGRAPLDGNDEQFLLASYRPGGRAPDPSDGLPSGVMIAMNGSTPNPAPDGTRAFPGVLVDAPAASVPQAVGASGDLDLPIDGPIAPERPVETVRFLQPQTVATMSYAPERIPTAARAFSALGASRSDGGWKSGSATGANAYVVAGTYSSAVDAKAVQLSLAGRARVSVEKTSEQGADWYTVNIHPDGHADIDGLLEFAWAHGAPDAFVVRE